VTPPLACPVCATPTVAGARFCHSCGAPLADVSAGATAERRVVTVLFGDLSDFTGWAEDLDPERVGVVTDRVLAGCAHAVLEHGGHVDKLTGDGIMAVFGAPTTHEDDAERAVRAADAMQVAVRRLLAQEVPATGVGGFEGRLGLRVGLNTGEVLAGVQAALSYTVVGDTVNTASRLAGAAPVGGVLAGRDTALATLPMAAWRALSALRLKGKRDLVAAYELVGLRSAPGARPGLGAGEETPLVGREVETAALMGRLVEVVEGAGPGSVLVTGDAGVGKTRLLTELARLAGELPGGRVLWGRCAPYGLGRDHATLVEIVRGALGLGDVVSDDIEATATEVRRELRRLERAAGPGAGPGAAPGTAAASPPAQRLPAGSADVLLRLLGLAPEEPFGLLVGATPGATPGSDARGAAEADAIAGLLSAVAAGGPLLLCVDDLQWATDALREVLLAMAGALAGPVLLVLSGRTDAAATEPGRWRGLPRVELLPLGPLADADAERLLLAYLGAPTDGGELTGGVREVLLDRAQGNPFFLAELLHLLVDRGVLRLGEDGHWSLEGELPGDVLPAGVQAVLSARIDSLDPAAKTVLRDAAVLGTSVPLDALVALAGDAAAGQVPVVVRGLLERQLLVPADGAEPPALDAGRAAGGSGVRGGVAGGGVARTYGFAHTLARDVAYASTPKADRARRHAAAARWALGSLPPGPEADQTVATHADRAVVLAREMALPAADRGWDVQAAGAAAFARLGASAAARDAHRAAAGLLTRAVDLAEPVGAEPALGVRVALAGELAALRRLEEAEAALAPALDSDDPGERARALVVLGDLRRKQSREDEATQAWVSALALASDAGQDRIGAEAIRHLGLQDYFAGRLRSAEERFGQALVLSRRVGDPRGVGWALQHTAWVATTRGAYDDADDALTDAAGVFATLQDIGGLSWCAGTEALVRVLQGRLTEARELIAGLLPAAEELGDRWAVAACLTIDALAAAELGAISAALTGARRAETVFAGTGDAWGSVLALCAQGSALRGADQPAAALELLERAVDLAERGDAALTGTLALALLGLTHLDVGQLDEAEAVATRVEAALGRLDLEPAAEVGARVLRAQVARARGRTAEALGELRDVADLLQSQTLLFPRRQALAHLAGVLLESDRPDEALDVARRALAVPAEDVRSRVLALRALGSAYAACGKQTAAIAALREAAAVAASTEQTSERAQTQRVLASVGG